MVKRRRWWACGLGLLAVGLWAACGGSPPAPQATPAFQGGPRIQFEQEAVDFGRLPLDKMVETSFRFTNAGDALLVIQPPVVVRVVEGC